MKVSVIHLAKTGGFGTACDIKYQKIPCVSIITQKKNAPNCNLALYVEIKFK